jgi:LacI family transcriptional regulator
MSPTAEVAVLTPARGARPGQADDAHEFAARLRVDVGGYGRGVRVGPSVGAAQLPDACAGLAGAVLLGYDDDELERLPHLPLPLVAVDSYARDPWFPIVRSDDAEGGRRAAAHLLALGHRRIAFATGAGDGSRLTRERRDAFELALAVAGVRMQSLVAPHATAPHTTAPGGLALAHLLAADDNGPTAVLAADAMLAAALVAGLRERGARVPTDISIMCFDGLARPAAGQPRVSAVAHDAARRSRLTADALFGAPASGTPASGTAASGTAPSAALTVGVVVVERASVGVPAPR